MWDIYYHKRAGTVQPTHKEPRPENRGPSDGTGYRSQYCSNWWLVPAAPAPPPATPPPVLTIPALSNYPRFIDPGDGSHTNISWGPGEDFWTSGAIIMMKKLGATET